MRVQAQTPDALEGSRYVILLPNKRMLQTLRLIIALHLQYSLVMLF